MTARKARLIGEIAASDEPLSAFGDVLRELERREADARKRLEKATRAEVEVASARESLAASALTLDAWKAKLDDADYAGRREVVEAFVPLGRGQVVIFADGRIEIRGVWPLVEKASSSPVTPYMSHVPRRPALALFRPPLAGRSAPGPPVRSRPPPR